MDHYSQINKIAFTLLEEMEPKSKQDLAMEEITKRLEEDLSADITNSLKEVGGMTPSQFLQKNKPSYKKAIDVVKELFRIHDIAVNEKMVSNFLDSALAKTFLKVKGKLGDSKDTATKTEPTTPDTSKADSIISNMKKTIAKIEFKAKISLLKFISKYADKIGAKIKLTEEIDPAVATRRFSGGKENQLDAAIIHILETLKTDLKPSDWEDIESTYNSMAKNAKHAELDLKPEPKVDAPTPTTTSEPETPKETPATPAKPTVDEDTIKKMIRSKEYEQAAKALDAAGTEVSAKILKTFKKHIQKKITDEIVKLTSEDSIQEMAVASDVPRTPVFQKIAGAMQEYIASTFKTEVKNRVLLNDLIEAGVRAVVKKYKEREGITASPSKTETLPAASKQPQKLAQAMTAARHKPSGVSAATKLKSRLGVAEEDAVDPKELKDKIMKKLEAIDETTIEKKPKIKFVEKK